MCSNGEQEANANKREHFIGLGASGNAYVRRTILDVKDLFSCKNKQLA